MSDVETVIFCPSCGQPIHVPARVVQVLVNGRDLEVHFARIFRTHDCENKPPRAQKRA